MAKFIEQRDDEIEEEKVASLDEQEETSEEAEQPSPEDDIPEKYRNKTPAELAKMHQEAEKLIGRQSQEVGELRKTFDEYIKTQLSKEEQAHTSTQAHEEVDFFDDPKKAVEYAISNHPKIKEAETVTAQLKRQEALAKLRSAHPSFEATVTDNAFLEWVGKSKFRTELLTRADKQFDFDAADELLTSWAERQSIVSEAASTETEARKQSVKKASTGNVKGSGESASRKVYRRADLIKLMQTDPDRYMSLAEEIRQAYAEGRVR